MVRTYSVSPSFTMIRTTVLHDCIALGAGWKIHAENSQVYFAMNSEPLYKVNSYKVTFSTVAHMLGTFSLVSVQNVLVTTTTWIRSSSKQ